MITPDVRHKHLIVRAEIANPPMPKTLVERFFARLRMTNWMKSLIKRIEMKRMFGPRAEYCTMEGNRGMTAFAIIETSHICVHTWDECVPAIMQLDVYTCSDLNVDDVIEMIETFAPSKLEWKFLDREHDLTLVSETAPAEKAA
jgi:S-adenosylmethionine/arginine decarboxylase-like enzyme